MKSRQFEAEVIHTDVLVIGGGGAGLRAAVEARKCGADVCLVSKSPVGYRNNTAISGGGIAAVSGLVAGDSTELHSRDTLASGRFLNKTRLVQIMVERSWQQVNDMIAYGAPFRRCDGSLLIAGPLAGHRYRRQFLPAKTQGTNLTTPLRRKAADSGVKFVEHLLVTRFIKRGNTVTGALAIDRGGKVYAFDAKATVLATGGLGLVYLRSDNAPGTTGDGHALAYEAGAALRDMEFVQFYPTREAGPHPRPGPTGTIYEFVLATPEAALRNSLGVNILSKQANSPVGVTRDILARAIMTEIVEGRGVEGGLMADYSSVPRKVIELWEDLLPVSARPGTRTVKVAPAASYCMGGVEVNENCETEIEGLYAAGEVCGGVHGANRLPGNSIAEILVFGAIAGSKAAQRAQAVGSPTISDNDLSKASADVKRLSSFGGKSNARVDELALRLRLTMWTNVGIIRNQTGLVQALKDIVDIKEQWQTLRVENATALMEALELGNMIVVSEMVCRAALARSESRGSHYRLDFPQEDGANWLKALYVRCSDSGMLVSVQQ